MVQSTCGVYFKHHYSSHTAMDFFTCSHFQPPSVQVCGPFVASIQCQDEMSESRDKDDARFIYIK